ncbi:MAG: DUF5685 family protein [Oscillospiraceae bacterium]|nr:DUF5685 family protein [Oscillospiraceae bacterium]
MYGYVRPEKGELKIREYQRYRGVYCGLCHDLRRRYGPFCRLLVNYDFTFLAMLLAGEGEETTCDRRCPVHPARKYPCLGTCAELDTAADETVILAWWKLRDGARDESLLKSLLYRIACLILRRAYKKATGRRPGFASVVETQLLRLNRLEDAKNSSLDETADAFACILRAAGEGAEGDRSRILGELLYHLGRIIYILDAVDDLAQDERSGDYNPLRYRFNPEEGKLSQQDEAALRLTLQHSHNSISAAWALLEPSPYSEIISNVIYLGLPTVTQAVFAGTWHAHKRERSKI